MIPDVRFHASFIEAMADQNDWLSPYVDDADQLADPDRFARYVDEVISHSRPGAPLPEMFVPNTTLWWVDGDTFLGRLSIRYRLNSRLRRLGGHIGYWIRPSARRQGHARAALAAALPYALELGIECALVTCDPDNVASRRIIEDAGGLFEQAVGEKRLYWVPTMPLARPTPTVDEQGGTRTDRPAGSGWRRRRPPSVRD